MNDVRIETPGIALANPFEHFQEGVATASRASCARGRCGWRAAAARRDILRGADARRWCRAGAA